MILKYNLFRLSSADFFFSSHSHITRTLHPADLSARWFSMSRSTFLVIFCFQYSSFEDGHTNLPQSCLCQKHPFTNTTVLYFGSTRSGHPGSDRTFFDIGDLWRKDTFALSLLALCLCRVYATYSCYGSPLSDYRPFQSSITS